MYITKDVFNTLTKNEIINLMHDYNIENGQTFVFIENHLQIFNHDKTNYVLIPKAIVFDSLHRDSIRLSLMTDEQATEEMINEGLVKVRDGELIF